MYNKLALILVGVLVSFQGFAIEDEVFHEPGNGAWAATTLKMDDTWGRPACIAYTTADDGVSTLEVVSFYDAQTDLFLEPEVHVITPFDVSFFEVVAKGDGGSAKTFSLLPVLTNDQNYVGARALFDDREGLVGEIRRRNRLVARFIDTNGEVKNLTFSLKGSSRAVKAQFNHCALEFKGLPELPALLEEVLD